VAKQASDKIILILLEITDSNKVNRSVAGKLGGLGEKSLR
jgi:hypothetical protein